MKQFKRYCKTLQLKNNPQLIEEYKRLHSMRNTWEEIPQGMKEVGIIDMEIYLDGTTLFMIMDTEINFDHENAMTKLAALPRQSEWETAVSKFQKTSCNSSAKEKWKLVERIFKMDQQTEEVVSNGYIQQVNL